MSAFEAIPDKLAEALHVADVPIADMAQRLPKARHASLGYDHFN